MLTAYTFVLRSIGYLFVLQSAKKRMRDDVNENASIPHSSGCGSLCQDRIGNFPLFLELGLKKSKRDRIFKFLKESLYLGRFARMMDHWRVAQRDSV